MLYSVEHHHFKAREHWLLFDVNALKAALSCELDGELLRLAHSGIEQSDLVDHAVSLGFKRAVVKKRVRFLTSNEFLKPDRTIAQAELGIPTSYATFMVNVSQRCNLTCPYCYVNEGHFDYAEKPIARMKSATVENIVDSIHRSFPGFGTYGYHFYGGEPLLNFKGVRRIVELAHAKADQTGTAADFHITTNGTLLTHKIADFMDQHRFTVYFSIDGDKNNHDELRKYRNGKGSFDDVERNLAYLRTKPAVHLIGSSVIRKGFPLKKAIKQLSEHGARQCKAERVRLRDGNVLSLLGDEHDAYIKDIEGLIDHYIGHLEQGRKPMDFRLTSKVLQVYTKKRRDFFCPAGKQMFGISADGEIYPCALHVGRPQSKLGDVQTGIDKGLQEAFRAKFSPSGQDDCKTCWTRHLCGGGCSAMVDRFGHEDCQALRAESEAAIAIYQHFMEKDPVALLGLVSPKIVKWANGEIRDAKKLLPDEPAAQRVYS